MRRALDVASVARHEAILHPIERHRNVPALVPIRIDPPLVPDDESFLPSPVLLEHKLRRLMLARARSLSTTHPLRHAAEATIASRSASARSFTARRMKRSTHRAQSSVCADERGERRSGGAISRRSRMRASVGARNGCGVIGGGRRTRGDVRAQFRRPPRPRMFEHGRSLAPADRPRLTTSPVGRRATAAK